MAKVTMPQLGESVAEGTIGRWLKQPGDTVAKYEPLLEVITDKVNAEVPSPFAGILREILAQEGDTVPNNAEIAVIETEDEARRWRRSCDGRDSGRRSTGGGRRSLAARAGPGTGRLGSDRCPTPAQPAPAAPLVPRRPPPASRRRRPSPPATPTPA